MNTKLILIAIICLLIGFNVRGILKGDTSYQQDIGHPKSVKVSKARHFFVGYHIETKSRHANGNLQWICYDGLMPVKAEVCKFLQKDMPDFEFTCDELVIVGLYEFKNKTDGAQFYKDQKEKQ